MTLSRMTARLRAAVALLILALVAVAGCSSYGSDTADKSATRRGRGPRPSPGVRSPTRVLRR